MGSAAGKESACSAGDPGSIPRLGRSPGEGIGYQIQYSWAPLGWLILGWLAVAAAKSLQTCPTLCDPIDRSPPGSPIPGISRQECWSGLPFPSLGWLRWVKNLPAMWKTWVRSLGWEHLLEKGMATHSNIPA